MAVNLSPILWRSMGATPAWATLALTLPEADPHWVDEFAAGFAALAGDFKLALVGGDTTQGALSITVTVHGLVPEGAALLRSAARVGDGVFVTGTLGDACAGLRCLDRNDGEADRLLAAPAGTREMLIERLNRPVPRVAQGLALRGRANACIDVSDGLLADLGHVCTASGVGAEIDIESLPSSPALLALFDGNARRECQLAGGDDYELCFSVAESEASALLVDLARSGCGATRIGRIVAGSQVRVHDRAGNLCAVCAPRLGAFFRMRLSAAQRRVLLHHPAGWIASGFGSGLSPFAPGTAGSLAALLPWLALRELPLAYYCIASNRPARVCTRRVGLHLGSEMCCTSRRSPGCLWSGMNSPGNGSR